MNDAARITGTERRVASIGGVLAGLALALRVIILPDPQISAVYTAVVVAGGVFFAAGLRTRLARAGQGMFGNVAMISWAITGAVAFVRFSLQVAPSLSDAVAPFADALVVLSGAMLPLVWVGTGLMAGVAAVGGARSGQLPGWFVAVSAIVAAASILGVLTLLVESGYLAWNGMVQTHLLYAIAAWFVLGSAAMWRPAD